MKLKSGTKINFDFDETFTGLIADVVMSNLTYFIFFYIIFFL